jgi:hypothetical protein
MANFGWAFIDCEGDGAAHGPTGSLQFISGGLGHTTGSSKLIYHTASHGEHTPSTLVLSGNLVVTGAISASVFHYSDVTIIDATGSTFFGDTQDDIHSRTGSLEIFGGGLGTTSILSTNAYSEQTFVRGFGGNYRQIISTPALAKTSDYILGIAQTGDVVLTIPSASTFTAGAVFVVKDEVTSRGAFDITLTCSAGASYTFDGSHTYIITGSMPAISLYSNGSNWFVF